MSLDWMHTLLIMVITMLTAYVFFLSYRINKICLQLRTVTSVVKAEFFHGERDYDYTHLSDDEDE